VAKSALTILDGAMGTELEARGVSTSGPAWSASALALAPRVVEAIHRDYAAAGAHVHTANTFRTKRRERPDDWEALAAIAVLLARRAVPPGHRVAASLAPIADCYRPDLSPADPRPEHREMAELFARLGVDLVLCEAFPHAGEALVAVEEVVRVGLPAWVSLTGGPDGTLMTPAEVEAAARTCAKAGAAAVLVNCVAVEKTGAYVEALARVGVPFGAYANAVGGQAATPEAYAEEAAEWVARGATLVGGCCGTGPAHVRALATT
jgi:S-methylmethionine-dependent homocysteine/selenocysteine methylase